MKYAHDVVIMHPIGGFRVSMTKQEDVHTLMPPSSLLHDKLTTDISKGEAQSTHVS